MVTIIIIENDRILLRLYKETLEDDGFQVKPFSSGKKALEQVNNERTSLVILDVKLQDMEWFEALEEIKAIDKSIPVILNSVYDIFQSDFRIWLADDFIVKSSDPNIFIETVRRYTAGQQGN